MRRERGGGRGKDRRCKGKEMENYCIRREIGGVRGKGQEMWREGKGEVCAGSEVDGEGR